ncbi:uncharacterized protein MELLADRAFT_91430 [Melampsora larici-populina 98AG31]|uniref:Family 88 glycosyl hydrolase n=1 Tax=Melampsora larici-populina (strain 98AG31 / pathotype 3-4-7) TaxID=747676 RepID=F4RZ13_MELLP|nr:uncharacterized protein MELLADRAFT_91430 [Melampsora larici-populina 98AG31]EGG02340.1 hypothetical protein MELLADRAFT_91430 [Melampsora larici-populina 98AG31]
MRHTSFKRLLISFLLHLVALDRHGAIDVSQSLKYGSKIYEVLENNTHNSWEFGTAAEVILERFYPSLSVYSTSNKIPLKASPDIVPNEIFDIIDPIMASRKPSSAPRPIIPDGALGDPASLGVAVIVAGMTVGSRPASEQKFQGQQYGEAAQQQLDHLLGSTFKGPHGEFSHRESEFQLWSDAMYMIPPFIAYYGAQTSNITLLQLAYDQIRLYRTAMQDPVTKTWRHILFGQKPVQDPGLWSTGNGWVAAGLMRVLATMQNIRDDTLRSETVAWQVEILSWVLEVINGGFKFQSSDSGLLPNYFAANTTTYDEVAGTALLASAAYRLVSLKPSTASKLPMDSIDRARIQILQKHVDPKTGIVSPVVNPQNMTGPIPLKSTEVSAEAQAFVLLMVSGWEAYQHVQLTGNAPHSTNIFWTFGFFSTILAILILNFM